MCGILQLKKTDAMYTTACMHEQSTVYPMTGLPEYRRSSHITADHHRSLCMLQTDKLRKACAK